MEFFQFLISGIAGVTVIIWVCVIALWHTYMFPRFFKEERESEYQNLNLEGVSQPNINNKMLGGIIKSSDLGDRQKYSMKSFVVADFGGSDTAYPLNRLYTFVLIGLTFATFTLITFGLHSAGSLV
tara:strand:- start:77 stop:454 length:378 start_codon:yes stop_codon:yes gene_type:complete